MNSSFIYGFIDGISLSLAVLLVPGVHGPDHILHWIVVLTLYSLIQGLVRPLLWLLTFPLLLAGIIPLMLGLNVLTLWLTSWLASLLESGFVIEGIVPALLGAVVALLVRALVIERIAYYEQRRNSVKERVWLEKLESYKRWLEEERTRWRQLAQAPTQLNQEQQELIRHYVIETVSDEQHHLQKYRRNWRQTLYDSLYRWHEPFYHWYTRQGWTWLTPLRDRIKHALQADN